MAYYEIIIRIVLATVLGGLIGIERQAKLRPAGFKTHVLVCVGSATIMILSELMFRKYYLEFGMTSDPARLGAQVISGVGFLGAGTIIHQGVNVRGLTTAASLWVVAAIGLAIGSGFYFLGITVSLGIMFILFIFNSLYGQFQSKTDIICIKIELLNKPKPLGAIDMVMARNNAKILDVDFINSDLDEIESDPTAVIYIQYLLKLPPHYDPNLLVEQLQEIAGVIQVDKP